MPGAFFAKSVITYTTSIKLQQAMRATTVQSIKAYTNISIYPSSINKSLSELILTLKENEFTQI